MSTIRIKGDTSGYIDLSAGSNDGALDISSSVTGAPVRTHSDLELETGGIHVKNPAGIEGLIVDEDTTNAGVSGRIVLKNSTDASSVYYSNTLGWTFHTGTILGNTSGTQRMFITPEGYQRLPYQPAFHADAGAAQTVAGTIQFTGVMTNNGNHYNSSTYTFTAPVTGTYKFSARIMKAQDATVDFHFRVNGSQVCNNLYDTATATNQLNSGTINMVRHLNSSDSVTVYSASTSGTNWIHAGHREFTGFLIG